MHAAKDMVVPAMAGEAAELTLLLLWHLALTALPLAAAALLAATLGVRNVAVLLAIGLAAGGIAAMLAFWAYYGDRVVGDVFAALLAGVSLGVVVATLRARRIDAQLLRALATPLALWGCAAAFLTFFGFLHGGFGDPLGTSAVRFSTRLPSDNDIPRFYAEWFYGYGHSRGAPVYPGDWLASDRPPHQIGYVLSQRAFNWNESYQHYQVLGVVLQQLWVVGAWALLTAAGVGRRVRGLAMVAILLSPLVLVNGFFVWPKLLPAAMLLAAAALLLTPVWPPLRGDWRVAALCAALIALAMLGHGSSAFAIIALLAVAAFRGLPSLRAVAVAAAIAAVVYLPWAAYQRFDDPPGNRVTKWMLAGQPGIDERGTGETIIDSYREAGIGTALDHKATNLLAIAGEPAIGEARGALDALFSGDPRTALIDVREIAFHYFVPSLGLLVVALVLALVLWRRRRGPPEERAFALTSLAVVAAGCLTWALLLFGGQWARTDLHVGSYFLPALAICGAVVAIGAVSIRLATAFVAANALLVLLVYTPSLEPPPETSYSPFAALLAAAALAGFVALALRARVGDPRP